jgi:hypothetical protein
MFDSRVVLPLPKKPVTIVAGIFPRSWMVFMSV